MWIICLNTSHLSSSPPCCRGGRDVLSREVQEGNETRQMKWDATQFTVPTDWHVCGNKLFPRTPVWKLSPAFPQMLAPNGSREMEGNCGRRGKESAFVALRICNFYRSFMSGSTQTGHPCDTQVIWKCDHQQVLSSKRGLLSRTWVLLGCACAESCLLFLGRRRRKPAQTPKGHCARLVCKRGDSWNKKPVNKQAKEEKKTKTTTNKNLFTKYLYFAWLYTHLEKRL